MKLYLCEILARKAGEGSSLFVDPEYDVYVEESINEDLKWCFKGRLCKGVTELNALDCFCIGTVL